MSYILDALNKADRERQLGHVPTLSTQHSTNTDRNRYLLIWLLPAVIILVVCSTLFWPFVDDIKINTFVDSIKEISSANNVNKNTSDNINTVTSNSVNRIATDKPKNYFSSPNANQHQLTETRLAVTPTKYPPTLVRDTARMEIATPNTIHNAYNKTQTNPTLSFAQVAGITHNNKLVSNSSPSVSNKIKTRTPSPQQQTFYASTANNSLLNNKYGEDNPLLLIQKTIEFQQAVPSIDLDVHVFSDDPSKRFVLINLVKYQEGQFVRDGLYLREITSAGIVFTFENESFLVLANQNIN